MITETHRTGWRLGLASAGLALLAGCGSAVAPPPTEETGTWAITAWGTHYEIYPEMAAFRVGETTVAHTHVTRLGAFTPLVEGDVTLVLAGPGGAQRFTATAPVRPGVFAIEITPTHAGETDLTFEVRGPEGSESIRGGRVRVGDGESQGALVVVPAPRAGSDGGAPVSLRKEEQWRSSFATAWVREGTLAGSVSGLATIRPSAGGEATITASVDAIVQPPTGSRSWPFAGLAVADGASLFDLQPLVATGRSLAQLEADRQAAEVDLTTATERLARLEQLYTLDAVSRNELDEARARARHLDIRHTAAIRDLADARVARRGGGTTAGLSLRAPFGGEIADVTVRPGATVRAGDTLARLVATDIVWTAVEATPTGARRLAEEGVAGLVLHDPERGAIQVREGLRLISIAPEISPRTGTVTVLLEMPQTAGAPLGGVFDAQVLTGVTQPGIVVPRTAVVDDGGPSVVYLQLAGERFARQAVEVVARQGDQLMVSGLVPGQRLVTRGGDTVRRASLIASGSSHGHVH